MQNRLPGIDCIDFIVNYRNLYSSPRLSLQEQLGRWEKSEMNMEPPHRTRGPTVQFMVGLMN